MSSTSAPGGSGDHDLLLTHAARWAESKKRPLDLALLETVLDLVTKYDERSAQAWPPGSARNLVLHRWPANGPTALPDRDALRDSLDTYWRFLRATGRMTSGSAAPADLVKELRRALPAMAEATGDRSNWSQGRVLQDFGSSIGIELDGVATMEEMQARLDRIMAAWNALPTEERIRLMPDPSPRSAMGVRATEVASQMLGGGAPAAGEHVGEPDPDDMASVYPHYRRGIPSVAVRQAAESGFARKLSALLDWLGDGKAVTSTGVLKPALAQEAFAALDLATWERRYEALADPHGAWAAAKLTPEAKDHDARARASSIRRAGENLALDRLWWVGQATEVIRVTSTRALRAEAVSGDPLIGAITQVVSLLERVEHNPTDMLAHILLRAMVSPDGEIDLEDVREDEWETGGFADRYGEVHEFIDVWRDISDGRIGRCVALFDDMALWTRQGDDLTITDFGREAAVVVMSLADQLDDERD
ncbi:hypothetical protein N802_05930 [Knoellia sinensis KCTC 19936]|uniref:Uncharacterized protein n=1 Tax=Knoellia sinensis KCTC 19936 TaxID=1385520 RepID=A0A0A0J0W6_9MICO|nr:hypothetical protein [Knoellia sinensis]KGN30743.1 hypothetical protein N802_05930 [Knoellia sinensis KCTC 19936]